MTESYLFFTSKAMSLSHISRRLSTAGEMVNLMAVDAQKVMQLVQSFNQVWSAPFQICVAIYFLYVTMGVATLAGVGVLLLLVPLNLLLARLVRNIQVNHFKHCWSLHVSNHTVRVKHKNLWFEHIVSHSQVIILSIKLN